MLLGMGIRYDRCLSLAVKCSSRHLSMATDLNLHRKTAAVPHNTDADRARVKEVLNRERTWLYAIVYIPAIVLSSSSPIAYAMLLIEALVHKWANHTQ